MSQTNSTYDAVFIRAGDIFKKEKIDVRLQLYGVEMEQLRMLDKAITWLDRRYIFSADCLGETASETTLVLLQELSLIKKQQSELRDSFHSILLALKKTMSDGDDSGRITLR